MSLAQITLTTNKTVSNVDDYVRKIRQGEAGQRLEVIITDADGSGYNLDGKTLEFSENKEGGKIVSDNDQDHFEIKDAKAGRFVYTLAPAVYAASGTAWFDITSADGSVIDTTKNFNIDVIEDESIHINNDNYVSNLISLETHYDGVIKKAKEDSEALLAKMNDQLKANKDANDAEIADAKKQLDDELAKIDQSQYVSLNNRIAELENNSQTLHLLGHNWDSISSHSRNAFTARRQFFVNDSTLTNPNGYANAKATGDAINTVYQQLNHAIGLIMAVLDSLDKKQVIIDIKNRLSALEDREKKENK